VPDRQARIVEGVVFFEFGAQRVFEADQDQFGFRFLLEECERCRNGNRGAVIAAHAVNGEFNCHLSGWTAASGIAGGGLASARCSLHVRVSEIENDGVQARIAAGVT
jgi:hypothetical protein